MVSKLYGVNATIIRFVLVLYFIIYDYSCSYMNMQISPYIHNSIKTRCNATITQTLTPIFEEWSHKHF